MRRMPMIVMGLALPMLAPAQDSHQVARLEQDVRQLQREVSILTQLVNQLRTQADRSPSPVPTMPLPSLGGARTAAPPPAVSAAVLPRWVDAVRWKRVTSGMTELAVISELGAPTSVRQDGPRHVLFYALELGPSTFLSGSVTLQSQAVTAVETPTLK